MKISRMRDIIYFLVLLTGVVLLFFQFISLYQFLIMLVGAGGVSVSFYNADKMAEGSILKNNRIRVEATLAIIVVFLSCWVFILYPTAEGFLALLVTNCLILTGLTLTEWYEKAKLYDRLKRN